MKINDNNRMNSNNKQLRQKLQSVLLQKKYTTPGWSSIQQNAQSTPKANSQLSILSKIKSSKHIDLQSAKFKNIKTKTDIDVHAEHEKNNFFVTKLKDKNVHPYQILSQSHQRNNRDSNITPKTIIHQSKTDTRSNKMPYNNNCSSTQISYQASIIRNYSKTPVKRYEAITQSWIRKITPTNNKHSPAQVQTMLTYKLKSNIKNNENNDTSSSRRFKQITVHQHLFLQSKRKQTKKMVQKIIQEEYSKKKFSFWPTISERSQFLANNKYQKDKDNSKLISQFQIENQNIEKLKSKQTSENKNHNSSIIKLNREQDKENQQKYQYTILNKTFYYLTNNARKINKQQFAQKVLQFPMPCIKQLEPIFQEMFKNKNKEMTWTEFVSNFNSKCKTKQSFVCLMSKFFDKIQPTISKESRPLQVSKFYDQNL